MSIKRRRESGVDRDAFAGAALVAAGMGLYFACRDYSWGTLAHPGPGFFPVTVAVLLVIFGAIIFAGSLASEHKQLVQATLRPRSLLGVAGIALFGVLVDRFGFAISASLLLVLAVAAGSQPRIRDGVVLIATLVPVSILLFIVGLGQLMPIWPR